MKWSPTNTMYITRKHKRKNFTDKSYWYSWSWRLSEGRVCLCICMNISQYNYTKNLSNRLRSHLPLSQINFQDQKIHTWASTFKTAKVIWQKATLLALVDIFYHVISSHVMSWPPLQLNRTGNSTIRSADSENHILEPNTKLLDGPFQRLSFEISKMAAGGHVRIGATGNRSNRSSTHKNHTEISLFEDFTIKEV